MKFEPAVTLIRNPGLKLFLCSECKASCVEELLAVHGFGYFKHNADCSQIRTLTERHASPPNVTPFQPAVCPHCNQSGVSLRHIFDECTPNFATLLKCAGSMRRLLSEYWSGAHPPRYEREIESSIPPEVRIGYRPIS